ncbi:hypothetical protein Purlil1_12157 [Purpureocillium lilacinum]|uniref:Uncharacterized protein n=1 Tax=Purpureocillium lilacinum TaxID=33203 RepID=A0ABR0BHN3_PURLI|nr:hypothetical protein Purlil1_12157 [Purpureocillium lilacinum]
MLPVSAPITGQPSAGGLAVMGESSQNVAGLMSGTCARGARNGVPLHASKPLSLPLAAHDRLNGSTRSYAYAANLNHTTNTLQGVMGLGAKEKTAEEVAHVPPQLSDLHCFTETEGVITTSNHAFTPFFGSMLVHTGENLLVAMMDLPGYRVEKVLGTAKHIPLTPPFQVYGMSVRSRNIAASLGMVTKSFAGGELRWFTSMLYSCRNDSISRVVDECKRRGGNAIICLRFDAGDMGEAGDMGGFAQTAAYGTACIVRRIDESVEVPSQLVGA